MTSVFWKNVKIYMGVCNPFLYNINKMFSSSEKARNVLFNKSSSDDHVFIPIFSVSVQELLFAVLKSDTILRLIKQAFW